MKTGSEAAVKHKNHVGLDMLIASLLLLNMLLSFVAGSVPQQKRPAAEQQSSRDDVSERNEDDDDDDDDADDDNEYSLGLHGRARYFLCSVASCKLITVLLRFLVLQHGNGR